MRKGLLITIALLLFIATPNLVQAEENDDISGHYFESSMRELIYRGILTGYGDGIYKPDSPVTRAEFTTFLLRMLEVNPAGPAANADNPFNDIESDKWYYAAVITAEKMNLVNGYPGGKFQPDKKITRQELAAMIKRALDSQGIYSQEATLEFEDNDAIHPMFKPSIQQLLHLKILNGKMDSKGIVRFAPNDFTTRGEIAAVIDRVLTALDNPNAGYRQIITDNYNHDFSTVLDIQAGNTPKVDGAGTLTASKDLVAYYANPENFTPDSPEFFQFLLLTYTSDITAEQLNKEILKDKGSLSGTGDAFITAGETYDINPIYLIAHALHETANGTSYLASGNTISGKTVYNMYGIRAFDSCPEECGSKFAYEQEWFTPEDAIIGGAAFIHNGYIGAGQNTLYEMRWNPESPGKHQYATHVSWAIIQAEKIQKMYSQYDFLSKSTMTFEMPAYQNPIGKTELPTGDKGYAVNEGPRGMIGETTDNLNFRTTPSTRTVSNKIKLLPKGTKVTLIGQNGPWYKVDVDGTAGWVYAEYISFEKMIQVEDISSHLNVRATPSLSGEVVGSLQSGDIVLPMTDEDGNIIQEDDWYQIYHDGKLCWVYSEYVNVIE